jgi:hypothetical protein
MECSTSATPWSAECQGADPEDQEQLFLALLEIATSESLADPPGRGSPSSADADAGHPDAATSAAVDAMPHGALTSAAVGYASPGASTSADADDQAGADEGECAGDLYALWPLRSPERHRLADHIDGVPALAPKRRRVDYQPRPGMSLYWSSYGRSGPARRPRSWEPAAAASTSADVTIRPRVWKPAAASTSTSSDVRPYGWTPAASSTPKGADDYEVPEEDLRRATQESIDTHESSILCESLAEYEASPQCTKDCLDRCTRESAEIKTVLAESERTTREKEHADAQAIARWEAIMPDGALGDFCRLVQNATFLESVFARILYAVNIASSDARFGAFWDANGIRTALRARRVCQGWRVQIDRWFSRAVAPTMWRCVEPDGFMRHYRGEIRNRRGVMNELKIRGTWYGRDLDSPW